MELDGSRFDLLLDEVLAPSGVDKFFDQQLLEVEIGGHIPEDVRTTEDDHDLVLMGPDGAKAKFEISDVSGARDGNNKEKKDLISLGVLREGKGDEMFPNEWPKGRLFLVVSDEFAGRLRKPGRAWLKGTPPHCRYNELAAQGTTGIFEVEKGTDL
jgi:hypothetical protein